MSRIQSWITQLKKEPVKSALTWEKAERDTSARITDVKIISKKLKIRYYDHILGMSGKMRKSQQRNRRCKEELNGNFRTEKYNNGNRKKLTERAE